MAALWTWIMTLTFTQQLTMIGLFAIIAISCIVVVVLLVIRLLRTVAYLLDKANIKSVSLKGVECYPDDKPVKKTTRKRIVKS